MKRLPWLLMGFLLLVMGYGCFVETPLNAALLYHPPSLGHWLGCDVLGRDNLLRLCQACSSSLLVGCGAAILDVLFGSLAALLSLCGRRADACLCALLNLGFGLPYLVLAALMSTWGEAGLMGTICALAVVGWIPTARLLRGQLLNLQEREFVISLRLLGLRSSQILVRHLLPILWPTLLAQAMITLPQAILGESTLSFLGLGVAPPHITLGVLCREGLTLASSAPWLAWPPLTALSLLVGVLLTASELFRARILRDRSYP
ncbi:MAG: ABC transporter permease [Chlamydiia bacterium]